MSDPIFVEFENTLSDHLAAERLFYKSTFWAKGDKVVAVLLVIGGLLLLVFSVQLWWLSIAFFFIAAAEWFHMLSPSALRTRFFFKRNPKFLEKYNLSFSDSGIHFKTASIDSDIAWTHYSRWIEDDYVFLMIYGSRMYSVIPKRAFSDPEVIAAFRSLISRHIRIDRQ